MTLAFRCAHRGGKCDCVGDCALERALAAPAPTCLRCGHPMPLDDHFRLDHQQTDSPGVTMQLVEFRRGLEQAGVDAWGAEVRLYRCGPCDTAEALFVYPDKTS